MRTILLMISVFLISVILWFGCAAAIMILWNWLMPDIFGLKEISYWQSVGLVIMCNLLVGSTHHFEIEKGE